MKYLILYFCTLITLLAFSCKKPYEPKVVNEIGELLVVEGVINGNPNSTTTIALSHLRRLKDTSTNIPELNAQIAIEDETGSSFPLQERDNGYYLSGNLTLDASKKYRLSITTENGNRYASDLTGMLRTPAIDSITWQQQSDVTLFANTHDPLNQTHYYRWDYVETWEYHSYFDGELRYVNDSVVFHTPADQTHICWQSDSSTEIAIGSSIALSEDVIRRVKIGTIPQNSTKGSERYSALVRQYALSPEAYQYWQILQKTSQQLGTLFDVQPAQLQGNIHALSGSSEPVIGYISASGISEQRIFINHSSLTDWDEFPSDITCKIEGIIPQILDAYHLYFADGVYAPYYFVSGGGVAYTRALCVDCTLQGGTTLRPSFW